MRLPGGGTDRGRAGASRDLRASDDAAPPPHASGKVRYGICAGSRVGNGDHPLRQCRTPPGLLVRADGSGEWLEATGVPLGLLPDLGYVQKEVRLDPWDVLVLYSDGISEAMNSAEEEYGRERLRRVCIQHRGDAPKALMDAIEQDVTRFAAGVPFADDRTLVVLKRVPGSTGGCE